MENVSDYIRKEYNGDMIRWYNTIDRKDLFFDIMTEEMNEKLVDYKSIVDILKNELKPENLGVLIKMMYSNEFYIFGEKGGDGLKPVTIIHPKSKFDYFPYDRGIPLNWEPRERPDQFGAYVKKEAPRIGEIMFIYHLKENSDEIIWENEGVWKPKTHILIPIRIVNLKEK